ncbi:AHH domain-containing protein [Pseudomonas fluorescens]
MIAAGKTAPNFKNFAHHIIMSNSNDIRMKWLQRKIRKLGIDINDADNGVFLPATKKVKQSSGSPSPAPPSLHTEKYKQNVFDRLKGTTKKSDFEKELIKINKEIQNGSFLY